MRARVRQYPGRGPGRRRRRTRRHGLAVADGTWLNWTHSAPLSGWIDLARNGLAATRRLGDRAAEARFLECLGEAHSSSHQFTDSEDCLRQALAIRHELGDRMGEATVLNALGLLFLRSRKLADAADQFRQAGDIFQETGNAYWLTYAHINLAEIHAERGHQRTALVFRRAGDPFRQALAWHGAGLAYHQLERDDEAAAFHRQAAAVFHDLADSWNEALALDGLAVATAPVDTDAARRHWNDALALLTDYEDDRAVALRERIRSRTSADG